jgi:peptidoglycan hydrolase-like protein with peptidoglycan-binding domain
MKGEVTAMSDQQLQRPLQRGDKQGQVKLIQEWLCLHGHHVAIDGDFGPASEAAVKEFQAKSGLRTTGVVDVGTFGRLVAPMMAALAALPANSGSLGELVVAYARQHLAQHPLEIGGQNRGPWVRLYMDGNEGQPWAWCAGFACFCLKRACESRSESVPITPSYSCDALAAAAKAKGKFVGRDKVGPGSFFLVRNTPSDWTHTGIVASASGETFKTIEGNTNDDGSREGYEVCARTRGYGNMDFIMI